MLLMFDDDECDDNYDDYDSGYKVDEDDDKLIGVIDHDWHCCQRFILREMFEDDSHDNSHCR